MFKNNAKIIGIFGLPLVGKDTLINAILTKHPKAKVAVINSGDIVRHINDAEANAKMAKTGLSPLEDQLRAEIARQIGAYFRLDAGMILLNGFPRFGDQVQWLIDNYHDSGISFIKLLPSSQFDVRQRAARRNRDEFDREPLLSQRITAASKLYRCVAFIG